MGNATTGSRSRSGTGTPTATGCSRASDSASGPRRRRRCSAFFPGIGPLSRIRHSFSPVITWNYQPAADVPEEFARAIALPGQPVELRSDAQQQRDRRRCPRRSRASTGPSGGDTTSRPNSRKIRLLSISTSGITYDFEQAKKPGLTGWATQSITNSLLSDLLPGFNLSLTHDLWRGAGRQSTPSKFDPFLQNVSASFAISGNTFRAIGSIFGLGGKSKERATARGGRRPRTWRESGRRHAAGLVLQHHPGAASAAGPRLHRQLQLSAHPDSAPFRHPGPRTRPRPAEPGLQHQLLAHAVLVAVAGRTQYNITDGQFESQVVRLERELHEWRAGFNFVKNPNGNFAFYFSIYLTDLPELKFDYDQTTFEQ